MQLIPLLMCLCMQQTMAVKVIVIPQNVRSHVMFHAKLASLLAAEGHVVDLLLPKNANAPDLQENSARILWHNVKSEVPFVNTEHVSQMFVDYATSTSFLQQVSKNAAIMKEIASHWDEDCDVLLGDEGIRRHVSSAGYEVAIVDTATMKCQVSLIYPLNIPIILFGVLTFEWMFRVPSLPSFVPLQLSRSTDKMSFLERLENTLLYVFGHVGFLTLSPRTVPGTDPAIPVSDIFRRAALFFVLDDVSVAYPRPLMPNVIYVGDVIPEAGRPLPARLAAFVDGAAEGVVIFSFGSYFSHMPIQMAHRFCAAFKRIPQRVVWKLTNRTLCDADPDKVLLMDWIPQNDLLSHANVKLFISHCGINSILESVYHSVPIIGFPICLDQPFNARRLERRGLGYNMKINDFSVEELISKIARALSDDTMAQTIKRASALIRNKPDSPEERISYWVEHVVTHGYGHLRSEAFELNIFQFYCLDVLLVILTSLVGTVVLLYCCVKAAWRKIKCCCLIKKIKVA